MKVPSFLASNRRAIISIISLLAISKSSNVVEATEIQLLETKEPINPNQSASGESLKACVRHPKIAQYFCAKAQQLQNVRKNIPEIDPVTRPEDALLNVTDEESDTAVEIFGCDCIASINCLRRLRNKLP
ncbi:MAG: hypothetical protein AAGE84_05120 [Cyanobacteria bacterium P01_G01_bin.39]